MVDTNTGSQARVLSAQGLRAIGGLIGLGAQSTLTEAKDLAAEKNGSLGAIGGSVLNVVGTALKEVSDLTIKAADHVEKEPAPAETKENVGDASTSL